MSHKHLITTAIAYGNSRPHIGHAFEFITADTHTRYRKMVGEDIFFVTGMDEHGQKIEQKAKEEGIPVQEFVDKYAKNFLDLDKKLSIDWDFFVRTSDKKKHHKGAQALWEKLDKAGAIEKRTYKSLYCVGCEEFKKSSDLNEKGQCPNHLTKPEIVEEENHFFKLSKYSAQIKEKINSGEMKIYPKSRENEIMSLIERGLDDVSFSRPKEKVSWGIPVPNDELQVMYVWCDALSNYITAIGYGTKDFDEELWKNTTHIIGKDILRFHAAIWPAMLIAAGLSVPKRILVHGFITSDGQKMSKTLGNVIDPEELLKMFDEVTEFSGDALRFVLLHEIPSFEDGDLTLESIKASYNAHLANGIGNLTSRIMKMATIYGVVLKSGELQNDLVKKALEDFNVAMGEYNIFNAIRKLEIGIGFIDEYISNEEPFKKIKIDEENAKKDVYYLLSVLSGVAVSMKIIMPNVSAKIIECIKENKMPEKPLFSRL